MNTKNLNQFLSCDWGTSSFRLRLVDAGSLEVVDEVRSDSGIASTYNQWLASTKPESERHAFYKKILTDATQKIKGSQKLPVILSGMASSTIGIQELPYVNFPFAWKASQLLVRKIDSLYLVSGMRTATDIMRGEETMLLGSEPKGGHEIYIFPGTHSKHVFVENGIATDFKTYITGELFNLMIKNSILKNSLEAGEDLASFEFGVGDVENENLLHTLFRVRAKHVLNNSSLVSNYQYLSGLIIGAELKDLKSSSYDVTLVGEDPLIQSYKTAMSVLGIKKIHCVSATRALVSGHGKIFNEIISV